MSLTSKSPRTVILVALAVGRKSLADHTHRCSPKVFKPQLFACLALMTFLRTDYRGIEQHLRDCPYGQQLIGLKSVPDHATLHRAARRFFATSSAEKILATTIALMKRRWRGPSIVPLAAADSTGLETGHRSAYFVRRKARGQKHAINPLYQTTSYKRFPKLSILIDCDHHLILTLLTNTGPKPDINELDGLLSRLPADVTLHKLVADAGYDSEPNHELVHDHHDIRSVMPATHGRPTKNGEQLSGRYRRLMQSRLKTKRGRQRADTPSAGRSKR